MAWARHGLWHGVRALGLKPGEEVLVPAYHHGSEVEAFLRTGLRCRFYDCGESLEPDEAILEALLGPRVRGLHLIHYAGFPQDAARWRRWCDERGLFLIEDAAQAWLAAVGGQPVGSFGDLAVSCLYKTVGLPEGAVVVCRPEGEAVGLPEVGLDRRLGLRELGWQHAMWVAGRLRAFYAGARLRRSGGAYDPAQDFDLRDPSGGPWATTPFLIRRLSDPEVASRRRRHYSVLLEGLADLVPAPFARLPDGACPFMLPISVARKGEVLARLRRHGVVGLDFWAVPHPSLSDGDFPDAASRRAATVGLPVHQELRESDLERIIVAAREATPSAVGRQAP